MENPIAISKINDFIFCPISIYFHGLDENTEKVLYQSKYQLNGTKAHESIDNQRYSSKKNILQGIDVYSEEYNLIGKIDIYDIEKGILVERKNRIVTIYDGYVYQVYGEYLCLKEMGYNVNELRLYSITNNKVFPIKKPEEDEVMFTKFKQILNIIDNFDIAKYKAINVNKCQKCIYEDLCSYSLLNG